MVKARAVIAAWCCARKVAVHGTHHKYEVAGHECEDGGERVRAEAGVLALRVAQQVRGVGHIPFIYSFLVECVSLFGRGGG